MWVNFVNFVVGSRPCCERFSPGSPVFPSPQKLAFPNSGECPQLVLCAKYIDTKIKLFIYRFI